MKLLLLAVLLWAPLFAQADDLSNLRRELESGPHETFQLSPEEIQFLTSPTVFDGPTQPYIARLSEDGRSVVIRRFIGIDSSGDRPIAIFKYEGEISRGEYDQRLKNGNVGKPSPGSPGSSPAPGTNAPRPGEGEPATGARGAGSFGAGLGESLGQAGRAGLYAGAATGIARGIIVTPSDQRELAKLQGQLQASAARMQAEIDSFYREVSQYDQSLVKFSQSFEAQVAAYRPLEVGEKIAVPSAFSESLPGQKALRARKELESFAPRNGTEEGLKDFGLAAADASQEAFAEGAVGASKQFADLAETVAGVALGINPVTALVQDGFELFTGRNFVTGRPLSDLERTIAGAGFVAGIATGGLGSSLLNATEITGKLLVRQGSAASAVVKEMAALGTHLRSIGVQTAQGWSDFVRFSRQTLGNEIGAVGSVSKLMRDSHLGAWSKKFDLRRIRTADDLNATVIARNPLYKPPYKPGTQAFDLVTKDKELFFRLHNGTNQQGRWVMRGEAIDRSLSAADLRLKYSLPVTPDTVSVVEVAPGTLMRRSKVNSLFGGNEGAVQYEIMDSIQNGAVKFLDPKPLGAWN